MDFLLQNLFWVILGSVSAVLLVWNGMRGDGVGISPQDAVLLINREHGVVVDLRPASDFAASHLVGARNIPLDQLESRVSELEKSKNRPIVIYGTGSSADRAVTLLQKQGFAKAAALAGGLDAWTDAGMPVES